VPYSDQVGTGTATRDLLMGNNGTNSPVMIFLDPERHDTPILVVRTPISGSSAQSASSELVPDPDYRFSPPRAGCVRYQTIWRHTCWSPGSPGAAAGKDQHVGAWRGPFACRRSSDSYEAG
jgi:hypothetical protein